MPRFLIIRFSSIGDIVLTTPVIRCLKQQVPGAEVHVLTKQAYRTVLEHNPYIDHLHLIKDALEPAIESLKAFDFDHIIDLHHNLRTLRVKRGLGKPARSFHKLNIEKWLLTNLRINRLPDVHIVDRYLETVAPFGVRNDGRGLDYFLGEADHVATTDIPTSHIAGYIALVIGAALNTKKLPVEKLQELCRLINHPIVLLGGPEDRAAGEQVASVDPVKVYNACGKFTLNESADLVRKARLVISHDTGLMHIAAAFQRPIISIWGNTVPAFGMGPYYGSQPTPSLIFEVNGLRCRPCSKIGYKQCPRGHFKCMNHQPMDQIAHAAIDLLARL